MVQQSNKSCVIILHYRSFTESSGHFQMVFPPDYFSLIFPPFSPYCCWYLILNEVDSILSDKILTLFSFLRRRTNVDLTPAHTNTLHWPMSFDKEFGSWRFSPSLTKRRSGIPCQQIMHLFPFPVPAVIYNNTRIIWKKDNTLCPLLLSRWWGIHLGIIMCVFIFLYLINYCLYSQSCEPWWGENNLWCCRYLTANWWQMVVQKRGKKKQEILTSPGARPGNGACKTVESIELMELCWCKLDQKRYRFLHEGSQTTREE